MWLPLSRVGDSSNLLCYEIFDKRGAQHIYNSNVATVVLTLYRAGRGSAVNNIKYFLHFLYQVQLELIMHCSAAVLPSAESLEVEFDFFRGIPLTGPLPF